ncbi:MAG TPA: hypothetical protein PKV66_01440 [Candidatus Pelethenecus sp.]|nr:hypothetical protein [Candidatus Pelethenecus sp.]
MRAQGLKKKKMINKLIDNFEEDNVADSNNITNEKQLNKTIKRVIAHNKKMTLKPIDTRKLLK